MNILGKRRRHFPQRSKLRKEPTLSYAVAAEDTTRRALRWFEQQRMEWIAETLRVFGFINREHLERKFGISTPQASSDLQEFQDRHPDMMVYNKSSKRYERNEQ